MNEQLKSLENDTDGMATYEWIVNHCDNCIEMMPDLIANLRKVDMSGQFLASTARYLHAVDPERFSRFIPQLVEAAIGKDRERRYIGALLEALWGSDYHDRAEELRETDDNFRRIYKRLFVDSPI